MKNSTQNQTDQMSLPLGARLFIRLLIPRKDRQNVAQVYAEEYLHHRNSRGKTAALLWLPAQIFRAIPPLIKMNFNGGLALLRNSLRVARRILLKQKGYSLINLIGLAVGLSVCLMIGVYVSHESSFDRHHPDHERIYRVVVHTKFYKMQTIARTSDLVVPRLRERFPQIEAAAGVQIRREHIIGRGDNFFYDRGILYTEPEFFDIFDTTVLSGDPAGLSRPGHVFLTESLSEKLYGSQDPFGLSFQLNGEPVTVAGVIKDPPRRTHLPFSCLVSSTSLEKHTRQDWTRFDSGSYIKLRKEVDPKEFGAQLAPLTEDELPPLENGQPKQIYRLQPVDKIHLTRGYLFEYAPVSNPLFLIILSGLGVVILLIAGINFINLTTARAATRAREVGIRKVVGAGTMQLVIQFIGETFLMVGGAFVLACGIAAAALPRLSSVAGVSFTVKDLLAPQLLPLWLLLLLATTGFSGLYPSLILSSFLPANTLKKSSFGGRVGGSALKRVLVVGQFMVSVILIITSLTMAQQIRFMKHRPLGFDKEQKLILRFPREGIGNIDGSLLRHRMSAHPGILSATLSDSVPGDSFSYAGTYRSGAEDQDHIKVHNLHVDENFISDYGFQWITPPLSPAALTSGLKNGVIVNETLVHTFGWQTAEEAVGGFIHSGNFGEGTRIIGVLEDFHFAGLQHPIAPLLISGKKGRFHTLTLSVETTALGTILPFLQKQWKTLFPETPFAFSFLDENFDRAYRADESVSSLVSFFSFIGIGIACFGLLGLAAFAAERRTKEIGIRKVLGASVSRIVTLVARDFTLWIILANCLAWPAAYGFLSKWLQGFHYRISLDFRTFLAAGLITFLLAAATVGWQAVKAARKDPVRSLRYE